MPPGVAADFSPYDIADPFSLYARARDEEPIFYSDEIGYWVVSRYDDVQAILKDPATFSSENTQQPFKPYAPEVRAVFAEAGKSHSSGLSGIQPPDHTRLRGFVGKAFTPRRIAELEPVIRELTVEMIERFENRGHADLVADLAYELPALVIFHLLGVPEEDVPQIKEWAKSRVALNFSDRPVAEQVGHAENLSAYWRYCVALLESRFDEPSDDLTGALARIYQEGDQSATIDEIAGLIHTQLFAGHETTSALLGGGLLELLDDHERWDELCADPSLIPTAAEELLRLVTPVFTWKRRTKAPTTVAGVDLPVESNILLLLGSANRDPEQFPNGEQIDLHRTNARTHLAFGHGIHFCLGASLARLEATIVLEELTTRLPGMQLVEGQSFEFMANSTFRGPISVLVEWEPSVPTHVQLLEDCRDVGKVGGKALSLGELLRAGLPVPGGFAVTTDAYLAILKDGLGQHIADTVKGARRRRRPLPRADSGRTPFESPRDPDARRRPRSHRRGLPSAVRQGRRRPMSRSQSARAPPPRTRPTTASPASRTPISGSPARTSVVEHVKRCWASLFSDRSLAYRHEREIAEDGVLMAVVVQRMVPAASAGVAMTLDPTNGDRCIVAIESSFGLGETVVGGTVTPDSFRVDKVMLEIVSTEISDKTVELVPSPDGGVVERELEAGATPDAVALTRPGEGGRRAREAGRAALRQSPGRRVGGRPERRGRPLAEPARDRLVAPSRGDTGGCARDGRNREHPDQSPCREKEHG